MGAVWKRFALGVSLALAGVALIEAFMLFGLHPLSPIGLPGLGMLGGAALGGLGGLVGGAMVVEVYYLVNWVHYQRFPEFYASPFYTLLWSTVFVGLALAIVALRPRVLRYAAAEAEVAARRVYEKILQESEQRLKIVTDNVPALVSYIDIEERYRFANRAYGDWYDFDPSRMIGRTVREVWGDERYELFRPNIERALGGERVTYEFTIGERQVLANYVPHVTDGVVKGFLVLGSDITQLAAARSELRKEQERLEAALDGSSVALWDTDLRSGRVWLSEAWARILGEPAGEMSVTAEELFAIAHPADVEDLKRIGLEAMKGARPSYAIEHRVRARDGEWKWILSRGRVTERDPASGRALRMIGTNLDITDRRRMEEAIQSAAATDALTGVSNRRHFSDRLRMAAARARRNGTQIALLYLDLDRFKDVNDTLGHAAGDALLRDFAARLRSSVRASDTVARFGGDEFVVLLEDVKERDNALRVAEKIVEDSRRPLRIDGRDSVSTASIGLVYSDGLEEEEALLRRADAALYDAKAAGRACYRVRA